MSEPPEVLLDYAFKATVQIDLPAEAQELVDVYNATFGSTGPGCCPQAVAAVLDALAEDVSENLESVGECCSGQISDRLRWRAHALRGGRQS